MQMVLYEQQAHRSWNKDDDSWLRTNRRQWQDDEKCLACDIVHEQSIIYRYKNNANQSE
jgi:hypothetical protein